MDYLIDTHTLIWAITDRSKLSAHARQTLENPADNILVSAISFWEISLKFSIGKMDLRGVLAEDFRKLADKMGFRLIPLSVDESASYSKLDKTSHKDLFDRMLIWQAIRRNLIFITKDSGIAEYNSMGLKTLW